MRVLTWNTDAATLTTAKSAAKWKAFLEFSPDIAMLQEVNDLPPTVYDHYHVAFVKAHFFSGARAKFGTALLAKKPEWSIGPEVAWKSKHHWVNQIQASFPGWLVGRQVENRSGGCLSAVSVHAPAFAVECDADSTPELCAILDGVDVKPVQLQHNPKLWFTEILWSLLQGAKTEEGNWIVAGDFNSSMLFDKPKNRGNGEVISRLNALGLVDCVFKHYVEREPTFWGKSQRHRSPIHQLDYVYANAPMLARLHDVAVGGGLPEEDRWLSDHLPIVCEFG